MGNTFPGDLYGRLVEEDLGDDYFQITVNLVVMLLINDWLINNSCFFIVLPLPDNRYEITVKREMSISLERKVNEVEVLVERMGE